MASFYETIFLKEDSSFEKKLNTLDKQLYNETDLYKLEKGIIGEKQVSYHLKKANIGMFALRDVNISCDDMNAQIDFIVITSHHCYFIECKNYSDDIVRVDENRNFEVSKKIGSKFKKQGIKSPLSQADDQLNVFKRLCLNNQEEVKKILNGVKFNDYFKTLVVFTNPENRLDLKSAPSDIKYKILKVDNLIRQIEYDQNHYNGKKLTKEEMQTIAEYILKCNIDKSNEDIHLPVQLKNNKVNNTKVINNRVSRNYSHSNKSRRNYNENKDASKHSSFIVFVGFAFLCLWLFSFFGYSKFNYKLSENQRKAISIMKSAYEDSTQNGFSIINTTVCKEFSNMFSSKLSCSNLPLEVNFVSDNKITIYKDYACYTLELSNDGSKVKSAKRDNKGYVKNDFCQGVPVGFLDWDENDEFYQRIGGYDKIKNMAVDLYNKGKLDDYYIHSFIQDRGGIPNNAYYYELIVDQFFGGVTGRGTSGKVASTGVDNTKKMCEAYYYIMK